jgi:hypothetical protein
MTKEEALKATLEYTNPESFEIETLDLSSEEFRDAMLKTGLIYETKDGNLKKRGPNGIFATTRDGKEIHGLSTFDVEEFINLGFEDSVVIGKDTDAKTFSLQKMPGDATTLILDGEMVVGFVSPTRDTRCHWISIPGDVRPVLLSFTTQMPPNDKGDTPLLENVWEKGPSKRDPKKFDFYHNDVSQKILASRCVQCVTSHLMKVTKAQWSELDFNTIRSWNISQFDADFEIGEHKFSIEKKAHEKFATLRDGDVVIGKILDKVSRLFKHYTYVEFNDKDHLNLNQREVKQLLETCYSYMMDENLRMKSIRKANKKNKVGQKTLTSLEQLA